MRQTTLVTGLFVCGLTFSGNALAVDPNLMNLVMPDAKILAGGNITNTVSSPTARYLITKLGGMPLQQGPFAGLGFNPLQNVTEVLAASTGNPVSPGGLLLASGTFPVDKLTALATSGTNSNWQMSTYGGATLLSHTEKEKSVAIAFPAGNSILIAGDLASVKAAIDRSSGANSIDPALALQVNNLSSTKDEWFVSSASVGSLIPQQANTSAPATGPLAQVLPLLQSIQGFSGGLKFGDTVTFTAEAVENSPQNAGALTAVIKLGMLMVGGVASNPNGNQELAGLVKLLQTMQVTTDGSNVHLSLSIPESQIETLLQNVHPAITADRTRKAERRNN
jgi:hypothetical protein